ncbi:MAG: replication-relaxation family protein [Chloroflexi bacterium]|nr:replication-relaxation family protein [Chloroflexota bacterium]
MSRPHRADAHAVRAALRPAEREVLHLLGRLPLAPSELLTALRGRAARDGTDAALHVLVDRDLVATLTASLGRHRSRRLRHLTDLGLAVLALDLDADPVELAARLGLGSEALARAVAQLPHLLATYRLLEQVARAGPGRPELLAWERPWRRLLTRPTRAPVAVTLPAFVALAWDGGDHHAGGWLLLPDDPALAPADWVPSLTRVAELGAPALVVAAATEARADACRTVLARVGVRGLVTSPTRPLPTLDWLVAAAQGDPPVLEAARFRPAPRRASAARPYRPVREGPDAVPASAPVGARVGRLALGLRPAERLLLELLGHHPFVAPDEAAVLLGRSEERTRQVCTVLRARGLVATAPEAVGGPTAGRIELTRAGLALAAAGHGLTPAAGARHLGLVGDGPGGRRARRMLLEHPEHTLGATAVLVRLARTLATAPLPAMLVQSEGEAAARRGRLRPDGAGVAHGGGAAHPFYLEYDRGTTSRRARLRKLTGYYARLEGGRWAREHRAFPTVLVVATTPEHEEAFARAARAAAVGRPLRLPLLLTSEDQLAPSADNPAGPLGRIWRDPWDSTRRSWPPPVAGSPLMGSDARV